MTRGMERMLAVVPGVGEAAVPATAVPERPARRSYATEPGPQIRGLARALPIDAVGSGEECQSSW